VDPKSARLVRSSADDAPPFGAAADDDRPATEIRPIALLDRRIESVHVHVQNREAFRGHGERGFDGPCFEPENYFLFFARSKPNGNEVMFTLFQDVVYI
jgi:hypothetical protein